MGATSMRFELQVPRLVAGSGAVAALAAELTHLGVRRPLIVSDAGLARIGHLDRVRQALDSKLAYSVFADVPENPTFSGADAALKCYRANGCDGVVALGGGSVIDTAKFVAVLATHSGPVTDYVGPNADKIGDRTAPVIVISTTAGTGSDASPDAGIHPDATSISTGITTRYVIPKLAICDPDLTRSLPSGLTAATGLDALSHCVEGYLSETINPLADLMALDGMRRVWMHVEQATREGNDLDTRLQMLIASFEGGVAIGKGLGPAHAIAIGCGDQGLHHGVLSALGMMASLKFLRDKLPAKIGDIERALGLPSGVAADEAVRAMMTRLGLPTTLRGLGYKLDSMDLLANNCAASHFNLTSPYKPNAEEFRSMIETILG
jgi:4-hydroxybutyrate dehydrogenase